MRQRHNQLDQNQSHRYGTRSGQGFRQPGHNYDYTAHYSGERFGIQGGYANQNYDRQNMGMQSQYANPDYSQGYMSSGYQGQSRGQQQEQDYGPSQNTYGSASQTYGNYAHQGQGTGREWDQYSNQGYDRDRSYDSSRSSMGSDLGQSIGGRYSSYEGMDFDRRGRDSERREEKRGRFFGKGPKGYKRSNERLQEEVSQCLWRAGEIDASDIEVTVEDGTVTLSGTVTDRHMKRLAEGEVEGIEGVEDVRNNLSVKKSDQSQSSETESMGMTSSSKKAMNERRTEDQVSEVQKGRSRNQMM